MARFVFRERMRSYPQFEIEAETLEAAIDVYARRTVEGDIPESDDVAESPLIEVTQDDVIVPPARWEDAVNTAIDKVI
jgi:hypothetical protein